MSEPIPGTRVPDTPIHRASLWLEDLKYGDRRGGGEQLEAVGDFLELLAAELEDVSEEDLDEAARFYAGNLATMLLPKQLNIAVPSPDGGFMDIRGVLLSVWLDGFGHGEGTALGKRGLSNREIAELGDD